MALYIILCGYVICMFTLRVVVYSTILYYTIQYNSVETEGHGQLVICPSIPNFPYLCTIEGILVHTSGQFS
jgi:hypothetical protein